MGVAALTLPCAAFAGAYGDMFKTDISALTIRPKKFPRWKNAQRKNWISI